METPMSISRKTGNAPKGTQDSKKQAKTPFEKANEHVVVTSAGVPKKQQDSGSLGRSPSKPTENTNKATTKANVEAASPKQRKPFDNDEYEEQLRLIRIIEKELRASGTTLSDLGINQGAASKTFPGLIKDLFSIYKLDILAIYETRMFGALNLPSLAGQFGSKEIGRSLMIRRDTKSITLMNKCYIDGYKAAVNVSLQGSKSKNKSKDNLIKWHPPNGAWTKMNVDRSCWSHSGMIGFGRVHRDSNGRCLSGFSKKWGKAMLS
ncbi:hypothetical protein G2W53_014550 [Senna tora]|uniref:Uncharacterized protein n=1 Tax=Senna tora TaxID=362788 RepID=A0A835C893_9FABA|nr:hypothetical protein G2W53_014550 [Senna tora]